MDTCFDIKDNGGHVFRYQGTIVDTCFDIKGQSWTRVSISRENRGQGCFRKNEY